ncbi:MAG: galactokinase [Planctomycetota bacterium]|nr:galactokinase [Planctomycetota bacterium]
MPGTSPQPHLAASPAIERVRRLAREAFCDRFGREPLHVVHAPGRVNLIGEHTDYNAGFVLPVAIDLACAAAIGPAALDVSRVWSREAAAADGAPGEGLASFDLCRPLLPQSADAPGTSEQEANAARVPRGVWWAYVAGVLAQLGATLSRCTNVDLALVSEVPLGGGLSSSAALEVATARAAEALWGLSLSDRERAQLCQRCDHEFVGVPCGIMDQYASSAGRSGHAMLIDCRSNELTHVPMPPRELARVLIFNTGVRHSNASGEYARRRATCEGAAALLGVTSLRDATLPMLDRAGRGLSRDVFTLEHERRARHVISENERVLEAVRLLREIASSEHQSSDQHANRTLATRLGALMNASHDSLRDLYEVSSPELDAIVEAARASPGVFGARMTGGGFGGCAIVLVDPAHHDQVVSAVQLAYTTQSTHHAAGAHGPTAHEPTTPALVGFV